MVKYAKNWWGVKWFEAFLEKNDDSEKELEDGRKYYNTKKDEIEFIVNSDISTKIYDTMYWNSRKVQIINYKFDVNEEKIVKNIIKNSPFYLIALSNNQLPEQLIEDIESKGIDVYPSSNKVLEMHCNCETPYCKHSMAIFYSLGLQIDKNPLLLFKIHGLNLMQTIKHYKIDTYKNKNIINLMNKKNVKSSDLSVENHINELDKINFNSIPKLRKTIDGLLEDSPEFFSRNFKSLYLKTLGKLSKTENNFEMSEKLNLNFKPFIVKKSNESEDEFYKKIFYMKWDFPENIDDFQIKVDKFYDVEKITNIEYEKLYLSFVLSEFFFEMRKDLIVNYNYKIQFTYKLYQFTIILLEKMGIIPEVIRLETDKTIIRWVPGLFNKEIKEVFRELTLLCPEDLVLFNNNKISKQEQIKVIVSIFLNTLISHDFDSFKTGNDNDIYAFFFNQRVYSNDYYLSLINKWLMPLFLFESEREIFLEVNEKDDGFLVDVIPTNSFKNVKIFFKKVKGEKLEKLSQDIFLLGKYYPDTINIINNNEKLFYDIETFNKFFFEILESLKLFNFEVKLPESLKKVHTPVLIMKMNPLKEDANVNKKGLLNLESLVDFNWKIAIGDKEISLKEFKKLIKKNSDFVKLDNSYILFNYKEADKLNNRIKKLPKELKQNDILQAILTLQYQEASVKVDDAISNIINEIENYESVDVPADLNGILRPYQIRGFSWLVQNMFIGFGSILADDMGLGKTLQVLTTILHFKNNNLLDESKVLVIAPTAVLYNWKKEIEKFTPNLTSQIYHGQNREIDLSNDILISSFGMIRSDFKKFEKIKWFLIVVDEAQNIKNPSTIQSKMVKLLKSEHKIALTGTPVENRLTDYWSIFDFTNKSYLKTIRNFKQAFINPIEKDKNQEVLENFKKITAPFILRRLKTDKKIINDLPDKIENENYCSLTKLQTALYQELINKILKEIADSDGIQRKGLVLKLINGLKQICNHPSQYKKSDKFTIEESGKMEMLIDILENTEAALEKVIIFTQFVQMGNIMAELIEEKFDNEVLFYHGSLTRKTRDKIVEEFQNNPDKRVLIVSLKAGGTGLNLTAASHVVHYDLWWNPAVENQATDRVYRIGQKDNVMVYRFITEGTFEEKINELLLGKKELAQLTVGTNENFVTEMNDDELKNLLNLNYDKI